VKTRGRATLRVAVVCAVLAVAGFAFAQTTTPDDSRWSLAALGLRGSLTLKSFAHFDEAPNDHRHFRDEAILQVEWSRRFTDWFGLRAIGEVRGDDVGFADELTFQIPERSAHRSVLGLPEAYATLGRAPFEVTLGKQIFAWGTADAWNPTDNLNPYDYLDPFDSFKIGIWAAAARATVGPASLTAVIAPVFTPSRAPLRDTRWVPPIPPGVLLDNPELPSRDLANMEYAARAKVTLRGWDVALSYFDGFEYNSVFRQSAVTVEPGIVLLRLTPVYTRVKAPGLDFATTFGKLEIHGEMAGKFVERNGRDDRFQSIAGGSYTWDALGLRYLQQIIVAAEYARETILSSRKHSDLFVPLGLTALPNTLVLRTQWKLTEETQVRVSALVDFAGPTNHYLQAKVSHKLTDALHVEAGVEFFGGDRDTFFGRYRSNDRFFAVAKYYF